MHPSIVLRIVLGMGALIALSTLVTVLIQGRTLEAHLEEAASHRLSRAANTSAYLLEQHRLRALERHRAIARTPEFRANLETAHVSTLSKLAADLQSRLGRDSAVLFTNSAGERVASRGDPEVSAQLLDRPMADLRCQNKPCPDVTSEGESFLLSRRDGLAVGTNIPLLIRGRAVGSLRCAEPIGPELLAEWSALSAARVGITAAAAPLSPFEATAFEAQGHAVRVSISFEAEREALRHLRHTLAASGALSIALGFILSIPLSRSLLRPLRTIEDAANRIREGDLSVRLPVTPLSETGTVAQALNTMLDQIEATQNSLQRAQRIGRLGGWWASEDSSEVTMTPQMCSILGLDDVASPVHPSRILKRIHPDDRERVGSAVRACQDHGIPFSLDLRIVRPDESIRVVHGHGECVVGLDGALRVEGIIQDVTERKRIEEQIRTLAYRDSLTGLGNRRDFTESLDRWMTESRQRLHPLAILFLDLDDFKIVNDTLGHRAGDDLLCAVAQRIETALSDLEWVGEPPAVYRLGGDEFAVIVPALPGSSSPETCAKAILEGLSDPLAIEDGEVIATASIGISQWPDDGLDTESLSRGCDTAMYEAKREGRGCFRFYDASMRASLERQVRVASGLRRAIAGDALAVHYQPKVHLRTGRIGGFEALLRWRDSALGVVSPEEFVRVAEETGQILEMGAWVLREAALQIRRWRDSGVVTGPISVNISGDQISSGGIGATVAALLSETGIDASQLELEITESGLLADERQAIEILMELKTFGVGLSLDDFGTGYSSLSYLQRLPIDTVKIDQSFARDIDRDPQRHAFVASMVSMASVLGLRVVAEGVETARQHDLIHEMGCEMAQGFFYGAPVPSHEIPPLLAGWKCLKRHRRRVDSRRSRSSGS